MPIKTIQPTPKLYDDPEAFIKNWARFSRGLELENPYPAMPGTHVDAHSDLYAIYASVLAHRFERYYFITDIEATEIRNKILEEWVPKWLPIDTLQKVIGSGRYIRDLGIELEKFDIRTNSEVARFGWCPDGQRLMSMVRLLPRFKYSMGPFAVQKPGMRSPRFPADETYTLASTPSVTRVIRILFESEYIRDRASLVELWCYGVLVYLFHNLTSFEESSVGDLGAVLGQAHRDGYFTFG